MIDWAEGCGRIVFSRPLSPEEEKRLYGLFKEAGFIEPLFLEKDRSSTVVYAEGYHMAVLDRIASELPVKSGEVEYRESGGDGDLWRHIFILDDSGGKWEEQIGKIVYFDGKEWV